MAPRDLDAGLGKGVPFVPPAAPPAEAAFLTLRLRRPVAASAGVAAGEAPPATTPPAPSDTAAAPAALRVLPERADGAREGAAPVEAAAFDVVLLDAPLACDGAGAAAAACCCCCSKLFGCCCWEPPAPPPASERVRPERVWRGEPVLIRRWREGILTSKKEDGGKREGKNNRAPITRRVQLETLHLCLSPIELRQIHTFAGHRVGRKKREKRSLSLEKREKFLKRSARR